MKKGRILIKDWNELAKIPNESSTHILKVDTELCNAWLEEPKPYNSHKSYIRQVCHLSVYLTTHSFYEYNYRVSSKILRACGFNVELDN